MTAKDEGKPDGPPLKSVPAVLFHRAAAAVSSAVHIHKSFGVEDPREDTLEPADSGGGGGGG